MTLRNRLDNLERTSPPPGVPDFWRILHELERCRDSGEEPSAEVRDILKRVEEGRRGLLPKYDGPVDPGGRRNGGQR